MTLPADPASPEFITVARILRARGRKGEVAARLLTDFPERLKEEPELFLAGEHGAPREVALRSYWVDQNHPGHCVFHFAGVSSIADAEKLRGLEVQIPRARRAILPSGSYFVSDLVGCLVFEPPAGNPAVASSPCGTGPCGTGQVPALLGQVRDVYFPGEVEPGTPLLAIDTPEGELLVPLAEDICTRIDPVARRIEVSLPEGLRELNRKSAC